MEPCIRPGEVSRCTADGLDCASVIGRAIVEENSVNLLVGKRTGMGDFFNVVWNEVLVGFASVYPQMPTIDEHGNFLFHTGKMMKAQGVAPLGLYSARLRAYRIENGGLKQAAWRYSDINSFENARRSMGFYGVLEASVSGR